MEGVLVILVKYEMYVSILRGNILLNDILIFMMEEMLIEIKK